MKTTKNIQVPLFYKPIAGIIFLVSSLFISCDSFVDVELPKSQLISKTVFENYQTANAALLDIYAKIRDNGVLTGASYGISSQLGFYADELSFYGGPSDWNLNFYNNSLLPSNSFVVTIWNTAYNQIYAANAVLEGSKASSTLNATEKQQLEGQVLFIRALLHFYLVNLYGDIPYITTTDFNYNKTAEKLSMSVVYGRITSDLQKAITLFSQTETDNTRVRPEKSAVHALMARVFLYSGAWTEAANSASSVIDATSRFAIEPPEKVFLKESRETIWQMQPSVAGKNTEEGLMFILISGPPANVALNNKLVSSFDANDLRKTKWMGSVSNNTATWYYAFKYKQRENTPVSVEYSIVFRLAEQYLIRAEARAQQENLEGAAEDLNVIRNRAGLINTAATTKEELLEAIYKERRWELFTEYGHRFFDLKRSGHINSVLSAEKPGWNSTDVLFPIPETELNLNPKLLPQNNGY